MKIGNLKDIKKDMEHGIYNHTNKGKCTACGECCGNLLPMTEKEIEIIRKYIKKNNIKKQTHNIPVVGLFLDMTCPFLDISKKSEKCTIYQVRPRICQEFSCDPKQRKPIELSYGLQARIINVRKEFYKSDD